jgi:glutamate 5-kinase
LKVVIKVGSQAIISPEGVVFESVMADIVRQIINIQRQGVQVILVSSGAVALGRIIAKQITNKVYGNNIADKQLLASLGQPRLMAIYARICEKYKTVPAQLLLTKYDFQTKRSYTNILRLLQKSVSQPNVLTIINENDSVAVEELMFTDNDELSGIIAAQIGADKLLLLTSIDGVYDKNPEDEDAKLISVINVKDKMPELTGAKTLLGRGGISSKVGTARKMALSGVMTHIASATEKDVIIRLVSTNENIGSRIIPERKKAGRKKFLAFGQGIVTAKIIINDCLEKILITGQDCISILPIGVIKFEGDFAKGDLIEITNSHNKKIGIGVARYNSHKLSEYIGNKNKPAFIHYDYLHIEV